MKAPSFADNHASGRVHPPEPRLLDSRLEASFKRLTRVTSNALGAPITFLASIDSEREIFWSSIGGEITRVQLASEEFERSFVRQVIKGAEPIVVEKAGEHPAVKRGEWSPEFGATSFAGAPLLDTDGRTLGAICVADRVHRKWSSKELDILRAVADAAAAGLELRATVQMFVSQKDIAEREWHEKAALLACIAEGVFAVGKNGRCSFVNPCAASMLGYSATDLLDVNMHDVVHPPSRCLKGHDCHLLEAIQSQRQVRAEDIFWREDGSSFPVTFSAAPLVGDDHLEGTVVAFVDITDRRRQEERLMRSEARLRQQSRVLVELTKRTDDRAGLETALRFIAAADAETLEVQRVGVWTFNSDRTEIRCVELYDRSSGSHSSGQLIISSRYPAYFRALRESRTIAAHDAITDPRTSELAQSYLAPNGITSLLGVPVRLGGKLIGIVCHEHTGSPRDWTTDEQSFAASVGDIVCATFASAERRRAEEDLRDSQTLPKAIIEGTADAVFVKDLDGRYVMINTAGARMMNLTVEEVVGKTDAELFAPAVASEFAEDDRQTLAGTGPRTHEGVAMVGQEKRFWTTTKTIYRDDAGEVRGLIGVAHDITEHRMLEQQLRQSQKIEAMGRLAGGIAHDFNNLLAIIKSYSEFLMRDLDVSDERRADVVEICDAADRAAALTRQLLVFSRRQPLKTRVLDLNNLVEGLETFLHRLMPEGVELRTSLTPLLGCIRADQGQVEQVIVNLVVNARDAMPHGGALRIDTENLNLSATGARAHAGVPAGSYVLLTVSDSGNGMDPDTLSHVFEPFFTTKDVGRGAGLGMSVVYGVLKASDGHITVDSAVGGGTTVRVFFPRIEDDSPSGAIRDVARGASTARTVLIVEDEAFVRHALVEILGAEGYHLLEAGSGDHALRISREYTGEIGLLISEVLLPRMMGRQLAEQIAAERPDIEVLYMSAFPRKALARRKLISEDARLISKPFDVDDLLRIVGEILEIRTAPIRS